MAEQLGGATVSVAADDLPTAVLDYAQRNNITQLVIGRSAGGRWRALLGRSLAHVLLERASGAALHVITDSSAESAPVLPKRRFSWAGFAWLGYAEALGFVALAAGLATMADRHAQGADLAMIFLLSVLLSGALAGFWPAILAAAAAAVTYNFLFLAPRLSFQIGHASDVLTFTVFFAVAITTGWLTGRVRDQARTTSRRAAVIASLLAASRTLSAVTTREAAAQALADQASAAAGAAAMVLLSDKGEIAPAAGSPDIKALSTGAMAAARWAWEKGEPAGAGTGTMPQVEWTFWPLQGLKDRAGVAGVEGGKITLGSDEERLLNSMFGQGAVALERAQFASITAETEALRRSDKLRSALLNSISHDLRTPLSTVLGAADTLLNYGRDLKPGVGRDLLQSIREEADRLNRYVGNLLDMTRLEGGGLKTKSEWTDVRDVLGAAIDRVSRRVGERAITREFPAELSMIRTDATLLEQAVVNILENAIAYSIDKTEIEVAAYEDLRNVVISIEDEGRGIPTQELQGIFDKFKRIEEPSDRGKGVGLGLSISKGFVEAMGGRIAAASPIHGEPASGMRGTRILISLPKSTATPNTLL
jgi:two-component system sensor histidine kinase KdpD